MELQREDLCVQEPVGVEPEALSPCVRRQVARLLAMVTAHMSAPVKPCLQLPSHAAWLSKLKFHLTGAALGGDGDHPAAAIC